MGNNNTTEFISNEYENGKSETQRKLKQDVLFINNEIKGKIKLGNLVFDTVTNTDDFVIKSLTNELLLFYGKNIRIIIEKDKIYHLIFHFGSDSERLEFFDLKEKECDGKVKKLACIEEKCPIVQQWITVAEINSIIGEKLKENLEDWIRIMNGFIQSKVKMGNLSFIVVAKAKSILSKQSLNNVIPIMKSHYHEYVEITKKENEYKLVFSFEKEKSKRRELFEINK
jgi:hypothetical protein